MFANKSVKKGQVQAEKRALLSGGQNLILGFGLVNIFPPVASAAQIAIISQMEDTFESWK